MRIKDKKQANIRNASIQSKIHRALRHKTVWLFIQYIEDITKCQIPKCKNVKKLSTLSAYGAVARSPKSSIPKLKLCRRSVKHQVPSSKNANNVSWLHTFYYQFWYTTMFFWFVKSTPKIAQICNKIVKLGLDFGF